MIYGYARVSSKGQSRDGNSLEAQTRLLKQNGAKVIFKDSFTGTKRHRPELDKLLERLKDGDTLVVTKLDRVARSTIQGTVLIKELLNKGVTVNVLNMGVIDNTPTGRLIQTILFAFAEFERDMIVERTTEGKRIAKENNPEYKEGRKRLDLPEYEKYSEMVKQGALTVNEAVKELNISRRTWYNLRTQSLQN